MGNVIHSNELHARREGRSKQETLDILMTAAEIAGLPYGVWAYEKWIEFDREYFDCALFPGAISWEIIFHGRALGLYSPKRNAIRLHQSLITSTGDDPWEIGSLLGERFAEDVLLHEMIHQYNNQIDRHTGKESHNCRSWCDQVVRIGKLLGFDLKAKPIRQKRVDRKVTWFTEPGYMTRKQFACFPHMTRDRSYYEVETHGLLDKLLSSAE